MASGKEHTIRAAAELSAGDEVEAWHNGRLFHRGPVLRVLPSLGLFWIQDGRTGTRRLLDVEAFEIVQVRGGRPTAGAGGTPGRAADMPWFSSAY